jgi:hypothetical protein
MLVRFIYLRVVHIAAWTPAHSRAGSISDYVPSSASATGPETLSRVWILEVVDLPSANSKPWNRHANDRVITKYAQQLSLVTPSSAPEIVVVLSAERVAAGWTNPGWTSHNSMTGGGTFIAAERRAFAMTVQMLPCRPTACNRPPEAAPASRSHSAREMY